MIASSIVESLVVLLDSSLRAEEREKEEIVFDLNYDDECSDNEEVAIINGHVRNTMNRNKEAGLVTPTPNNFPGNGRTVGHGGQRIQTPPLPPLTEPTPEAIQCPCLPPALQPRQSTTGRTAIAAGGVFQPQVNGPRILNQNTDIREIDIPMALPI